MEWTVEISKIQSEYQQASQPMNESDVPVVMNCENGFSHFVHSPWMTYVCVEKYTTHTHKSFMLKYPLPTLHLSPSLSHRRPPLIASYF